jgi:hypothetical protein
MPAIAASSSLSDVSPVTPTQPTDVRDAAALKRASDTGTAELGPVDIVLTRSTAGINGIGGPTRGGLGYTAAKQGAVGLMRSYANNLAPHSIRVNTVHPTGVNTPMVVNDAMQAFLEQDPSLGNAMANALPVPMVEPVDISNAILWRPLSGRRTRLRRASCSARCTRGGTAAW